VRIETIKPPQTPYFYITLDFIKIPALSLKMDGMSLKVMLITIHLTIARKLHVGGLLWRLWEVAVEQKRREEKDTQKRKKRKKKLAVWGNQPASRELNLQHRMFIGSSPKERAWGIGDLNNNMNLARAISIFERKERTIEKVISKCSAPGRNCPPEGATNKIDL